MGRVVLFGVDQMILRLTEALMSERSYPNLERILHGSGSVTEAIPCWPAWTPTNWATIATGADPGAHGVFGWEVPLPDGGTITAFHSAAIRAETLWEAADRQGVRVGLVHYPASWPSRLEAGIVIDGCALPDYGQTPFEIAPGRGVVSHKDLPISDRVVLDEAKDWTGLSSEARGGVLTIREKGGAASTDLPFAIIGDDGYRTIVLSETRDARSPLTTCPVGAWSDWCVVRIGGREGRVRFRLIECDPDTGDFHLWRSQVLPLVGLAEPQSVMDELVDRLGPYQEHVSEIAALGGAADYETVADEARYQMHWFAQAMVELMNRHGCELVAFHWHWLDWVNHLHLGPVDPAWPRFDPNHRDRHAEVIHDAVSMIDEGLGTVLDALDDDDVLIVVSDHGNLPANRIVNFRRLLVEAGHTTLLDPAGGFSEANIDWEQTAAYIPDRLYAPDIRVNPRLDAEERARVIEAVVSDVRALVDPETGQAPVAIALPRQEATLLGWYGPDAGDVMVVMASGYSWDLEDHVDPSVGSTSIDIVDAVLGDGGNAASSHRHANSSIISPKRPPETASHGHVLPSASTAVSSNMAILAMTGGRGCSGVQA